MSFFKKLKIKPKPVLCALIYLFVSVYMATGCIRVIEEIVQPASKSSKKTSSKKPSQSKPPKDGTEEDDEYYEDMDYEEEYEAAGRQFNPGDPLDKEVVTWYEGALADIFPYSEKTETSLSIGRIEMARNETESIQIGIRADEYDLTNARVTVLPFKESGAPSIMAVPIRLLTSSNPSRGFTAAAGFDAKHSRGDSPGEFPEYYDTTNNVVGHLQGFTYAVPAYESAGIVVEATSTASTKAGTYKTVVEIRSDQGYRKMPVSVRVWNAVLPEPKDSQFTYTNWVFTTSGLRPSGFMSAYYDVTDFDDKYFTVVANYAKVMKKERQNTLPVPTMALLANDSTITPDGKITFNFTSFDRYIETSLANGSFKALENMYFTYDKDWFLTQAGPPGSPTEYPTGSLVAQIMIYQNGKIGTKYVWADENADQVDAFLTQYFPALYNHLKAKGWDKMWLQHVCDEPLSDMQTKQISAMYKRILAEMPTVRTLDAGSGQVNKFLDRELSIQCPQLDDYERSRVKYNALNKANAGVDVWMYTCVNPQGNYMSRVGDFPLLSARVIGWYSWQQGLKGYLHWGWNLWNHIAYAPNDPFTDIYSPDAVADAFLVYPDSSKNSVYEGPRATSVRDGWEDYEILAIAEKKNPARVKEIGESIVANAELFTRKNEKMMNARLEVLEIASK